MPAREIWKCSVCDKIVDSSYDRFNERIEYLRADGKARRAVFTIRRMCQGCVDQEIERRRPPSPWTQEGLF